jgi:hypothetical protein
MPFAVAGAAISAGAGLIGASQQSGAVSSANAAAQAALAAQTNRLAPYVSTGTTANTQEANLLGLNGTDAANQAISTFQTAPGYEFQMQQGLRGIDAGAASTGTLRSGATIKAEDTFSQGLANQDFNTYYNQLAGLSTTGENAAAGTGVTAGQQAQADIGAGTAQSSIYGNAASGLGSSISGLASNPTVQSNFNSLFNPAAVAQTSVGSVPASDFSAGF